MRAVTISRASITKYFVLASGVAACLGSARLGLFLSRFGTSWPEMFYSPSLRRLFEGALVVPLIAAVFSAVASFPVSQSKRSLGSVTVTIAGGVALLGAATSWQLAAELEAHTYDAGFDVGLPEAVLYPVLFSSTTVYSGLWLPCLVLVTMAWRTSRVWQREERTA